MAAAKLTKNWRSASSASTNGSITFSWKYVQFPVNSPSASPTATFTSHFTTFTKNSFTAIAAFHTAAANPARAFQNSSHIDGGGGGALKFPLFSTTPFGTRSETVWTKPSVWNSSVTARANADTVPVVFVAARSRIFHDWARVAFFVITIWMTRGVRDAGPVLSFPLMFAPASGEFGSHVPFRAPNSFESKNTPRGTRTPFLAARNHIRPW